MKTYKKEEKLVPDERIIELYWQRNEEAIKETNIKYGNFLFRIAYNILHDRLDCEECQNDTYLHIWNAIPPTKPSSFSAFIAQIVRNIAINRYKEKSAQKRIPSELTISIEDINTTLINDNASEIDNNTNEIAKLINEYVKKLPSRQQYIFIDRFYLAEPVDTIANDLSISVPTVYREIEKIKQGLKLYLERNDIYL